MTKNGSNRATELAGASNDAQEAIEAGIPYMVEVEVEGTAALLCHRWSCEDVEAKATAAKGSKAKKTDNIESYMYRDEKGVIALPGEYFRQSIINAAKFRQDPRSPRKSAMDLFKAGIAVVGDMCPLGKKEPDYIDKRRVVVQRNGITRSRPAFWPGWKCTVSLSVLLPEYINPTLLNEVMQQAGRLVGVGTFRPSFGRFQITSFKVVEFR